jgi:hypothetical protein
MPEHRFEETPEEQHGISLPHLENELRIQPTPEILRQVEFVPLEPKRFHSHRILEGALNYAESLDALDRKSRAIWKDIGQTMSEMNIDPQPYLEFLLEHQELCRIKLPKPGRHADDNEQEVCKALYQTIAEMGKIRARIGRPLDSEMIITHPTNLGVPDEYLPPVLPSYILALSCNGFTAEAKEQLNEILRHWTEKYPHIIAETDFITPKGAESLVTVLRAAESLGQLKQARAELSPIIINAFIMKTENGHEPRFHDLTELADIRLELARLGFLLPYTRSELNLISMTDDIKPQSYSEARTMAALSRFEFAIGSTGTAEYLFQKANRFLLPNSIEHSVLGSPAWAGDTFVKWLDYITEDLIKVRVDQKKFGTAWRWLRRLSITNPEKARATLTNPNRDVLLASTFAYFARALHEEELRQEAATAEMRRRELPIASDPTEQQIEELPIPAIEIDLSKFTDEELQDAYRELDEFLKQ